MSSKISPKSPALDNRRNGEPSDATDANAKAKNPAETQLASANATVEIFKPNAARETVETIAIAIILYLLMGFEAEGFVIPTGSMDPTLLGRHKEITCPECGHVYQVNSSMEVDLNPNTRGRSQTQLVGYGTCGNCRCPAKIDNEPSFRGDRIAAMKIPYELPNLPGAGGPQRWDSVIFKYPSEPEIRYIKRLIGLPGEELRISRGDLYRRPLDSAPDVPFEILRKPLEHQRAMRILVYDDRHRPARLANDPRWARFIADPENSWDLSEPGRYRTVAQADKSEKTDKDNKADAWSHLRYQHMVATPRQWNAILKNKPLPTPPLPGLITDFDAYNSEIPLDERNHFGYLDKAWMKQHWVGDLAVTCQVTRTANSLGELRVELREANETYHALIDIANQTVTLYANDRPVSEPAALNFPADRACTLSFVNIDDELTFEFDGVQPLGQGIPVGSSAKTPTIRDLQPVSFAVRGAADLVIDQIRIDRDIYYSRKPNQSDYLQWSPRDASESMEIFSNPEIFTQLQIADFADIADPEGDRDSYRIGKDHYFMLGDNSLWSSDSRAWEFDERVTPKWDQARRRPYEVPKELLIGKAFCVYWPHARPVWPKIQINRDFVFPFRPYFERMKWVR